MFKPLSVMILKNSESPFARLAVEFVVMLAAVLVLNPILESQVSHSENLQFALCMASGTAIGNFIYLQIKAKISKNN